MKSTTAILALALAASTTAAPASNLEARQQDSNIQLCKRLDCTGDYYVDVINLPVTSGVCRDVPDIFEFRPVDFNNKIRAVQPNGGTNCVLYDGPGCTLDNSGVITGGHRTQLNVAPYNFDNRTESVLCTVVA
ncbi:hypothetical protein CC80DRAFT_493553 [Byssothecium circinans]|uniref:Uncharacterized protein n=1 Tax=Byssothecium circinans TaxID=147558 RepID=A0A6A5TSR6_9PLEO|nr:hypothetical protein CC80DRAFT_493553 [Byssothecium circinans]